MTRRMGLWGVVAVVAVALALGVAADRRDDADHPAGDEAAAAGDGTAPVDDGSGSSVGGASERAAADLDGPEVEPSGDRPLSLRTPEREQPRPGASRTAAGGPPTGTDLSSSDAEQVLAGWLGAVDEVLASPPFDLDPLEDLGTAAARSEVEATVVQFRAEGLRQDGRVRLVTTEVVDVEPAGTTAIVDACVDASEVRVLHEDGRAVLSRSAPSSGTRHTYTLEHTGTSWVVAGQTFPDDPTC